MEIIEAYLTKNPYSRPGTKFKIPKGIVIHYVGNASSTAVANRNYFENLKGQSVPAGKSARYASSHEIIGLKGEVVLCVPGDEVAYHAGSANSDHYGIEVCHPDATGEFSEVTQLTLIERCVQYCIDNKLDPRKEGVIKRHYDVTGKMCPLYYVKNVSAWQKLLTRIGVAYSQKMAGNSTLATDASKLCKAGFITDYNAWKREDLIKLTNVPYLLCNLGKVKPAKGAPTKEEYQKAVQNVHKLLNLADLGLWLEGRYEVKHVVALIGKAAQKLTK